MTIKKSRKFPSEMLLAESLEPLGATKGASTSHTETTYSVQGSYKDFNHLIAVLSEIILKPKYDNSALISERNIILQEIARTNSSNARLARDLIWKVMYRGSPMYWGNLGTAESLNTITLQDVKDFNEMNYLSDNSLLVISGPLSPENVTPTVKRLFKYLKADTKWKFPEFEFPRENPIILRNKPSEEVNVEIGFRTSKNLDELYIKSLIRAMFARGWGSRIAQRLRIKEGLIYSWGSHSVNGFDTSGLFFETATSIKTFAKMVNALLEEIILFRDKGFSQSEFKRAKLFVTKPIERSMETASDYANWYLGQYHFHPDQVDTPKEYISKVMSVSKNEVEKLAKKYFKKDNFYMSVVGNVKASQLSTKLQL